MAFFYLVFVRSCNERLQAAGEASTAASLMLSRGQIYQGDMCQGDWNTIIA
jgi:hypothetical protein